MNVVGINIWQQALHPQAYQKDMCRGTNSRSPSQEIMYIKVTDNIQAEEQPDNLFGNLDGRDRTPCVNPGTS